MSLRANVRRFPVATVPSSREGNIGGEKEIIPAGLTRF